MTLTTHERPATRSRRSRGTSLRLVLAGAGIAVLTFLAGYFVAVRILFPPLPVPEDGIIVPAVTGVDYQEAQSQLRGLGLVLGDTLGMPHGSVPPGIIVAQDPLPGQQLRAGSGVRIGVSTGLPRMNVPDVVGFRAERATNLLRRLGFEVDQQVEPDERPAGIVIGTSPVAGTSRTLPSRVLIRVSEGPPAVPDTLMFVDTTTTIDTAAVNW